MSAVKKTISISEEIAKEASEIAPNFSAVVETALVEYLHHHRLKKAMSSFGAWADRKESSVSMVNELRAEGSRRHANGFD